SLGAAAGALLSQLGAGGGASADRGDFQPAPALATPPSGTLTYQTVDSAPLKMIMKYCGVCHAGGGAPGYLVQPTERGLWDAIATKKDEMRERLNSASMPPKAAAPHR